MTSTPPTTLTTIFSSSVQPDSPSSPVKEVAQENHTTSGRKGAIINALNLIAGASFLGIPFAFKQSGWAIGILLLFIVGYLTGT